MTVEEYLLIAGRLQAFGEAARAESSLADKSGDLPKAVALIGRALAFADANRIVLEVATSTCAGEFTPVG